MSDTSRRCDPTGPAPTSCSTSTPDAGRRALLAAGVAAWATGSLIEPTPAFAQQRRPEEPLLFGIDEVAMASGLGPRLARAVGRGTGLPIVGQSGDPAVLLHALERGDLHGALTGLPAHEQLLEKKGLAFDRTLVASNEYVLVGPGGRKGDPAAVNKLRDVGEALARIAALGATGGCRLVTNIHSGAQAVEAHMWKAAGAQPVGAWLLRPATAPNQNNALAALRLAQAEGAYLLVERGLHAAAGRGLQVLVQGDDRMTIDYHALLGFRTRHPGGRLMIKWLGDGRGRAAVRAMRGGYRTAAGR